MKIGLEEQEEVFRKNMNLAYFTIRRYFPAYARDEDMEQIALMALWKACMLFDPSRGTRISTYAVQAIRMNIINELRKKRITCISLDSILCDDGKAVSLLDLIEDKNDYYKILEFEDCLQGLPKLEQRVIHMRLEGKSQVEIAKELNLSQSYVCKILIRVKKKLRA